MRLCRDRLPHALKGDVHLEVWVNSCRSLSNFEFKKEYKYTQNNPQHDNVCTGRADGYICAYNIGIVKQLLYTQRCSGALSIGLGKGVGGTREQE